MEKQNSSIWTYASQTEHWYYRKDKNLQTLTEAICAISTVETVSLSQAATPSKQCNIPKFRSVSTTVGKILTGCEERTNSDGINVIETSAFITEHKCCMCKWTLIEAWYIFLTADKTKFHAPCELVRVCIVCVCVCVYSCVCEHTFWRL